MHILIKLYYVEDVFVFQEEKLLVKRGESVQICAAQFTV